jgi:hypothetical protein
MQEIERVTSRALVSDRGCIMADGATESVIADYMKLLTNRDRQERLQRGEVNGKDGKPVIEIAEVNVCGADGTQKCYFKTHNERQVRVGFIFHHLFVNPVFRVQFYRSDGLFCHGTNTERHEINLGQI